jgi:3D (Asp-Asp-Asp) domain-containing protein
MHKNHRNPRKTGRKVSACCLILSVLSFIPYLIMAGHTYIVSGGHSAAVVRTFSGDLDTVLAQAGITLNKSDNHPQILLNEDRPDQENTLTGSVSADRESDQSFAGRNADGNECKGNPADQIDETTAMEPADSSERKTNPILLPVTSYAAEKLKERIAIMGISEQVWEQPVEPEPTAELFIDQQAFPEDAGGTITTFNGETFSYTMILYCSATAYTTERQENKITATGTTARVGAIAVDPKVITYGSELYIISDGGEWVYGYAVAEDCGGGIKGNKIDLFFDTYDECIRFGVRNAIVYVLS